MCGKDEHNEHNHIQIIGSPPRVRERPFHVVIVNGFNGITPACAGKTLNFQNQSLRNGDHPRVCGKDLHKNQLFYLLLGSPPRVRERLRECLSRIIETRITPACAGKTLKDPLGYAIFDL